MEKVVRDSPRRGRKPVNDGPMSAAERKRASREKLKQQGGRELMVKVEGVHWHAVELMAKASGRDPQEVLKMVFTSALDRVVGVLNRAQQMSDAGASDEVVGEFIEEHMYPKLPPMGTEDA